MQVFGEEWLFGDDGSIDPFFQQMKDKQLLKWKGTYETLIRDNAEGSGKVGKTPWMIPAWEKGLKMVNAEIAKRGIGEVQLTIFS